MAILCCIHFTFASAANTFILVKILLNHLWLRCRAWTVWTLLSVTSAHCKLSSALCGSLPLLHFLTLYKRECQTGRSHSSSDERSLSNPIYPNPFLYHFLHPGLRETLHSGFHFCTSRPCPKVTIHGGRWRINAQTVPLRCPVKVWGYRVTHCQVVILNLDWKEARFSRNLAPQTERTIPVCLFGGKKFSQICS